jgi:hypothetical protein
MFRTAWRMGLLVGLFTVAGCHDDKAQCRDLSKKIAAGLEALLAVEGVVGADEPTYAAAVQAFEVRLRELAALMPKDADAPRVRAAIVHRTDLIEHGRAVVAGLSERRRLRAADPELSLKLIGPAADARMVIDRLLRVPPRCD